MRRCEGGREDGGRGGAVTEDKSERVGERDGCDGERERGSERRVRQEGKSTVKQKLRNKD